jgi:hypothetical protein
MSYLQTGNPPNVLIFQPAIHHNQVHLFLWCSLLNYINGFGLKYYRSGSTFEQSLFGDRQRWNGKEPINGFKNKQYAN